MADEAGVLDFTGVDLAATASADASVVDSTVDTTVDATKTADTTVDATKTDDATVDATKKTQYDSSGQPIEAKVESKVEDLPGTDKTPQEIRQSLKALRDLDPKHAAAVKQLHGAYERWEAVKALYPGGVNDIKAAKEFADLVGGSAPFFEALALA